MTAPIPGDVEAAVERLEPIAQNCANWSANCCETCGVPWQSFEVHGGFRCPSFRARLQAREGGGS